MKSSVFHVNRSSRRDFCEPGKLSRTARCLILSAKRGLAASHGRVVLPLGDSEGLLQLPRMLMRIMVRCIRYIMNVMAPVAIICL